MVARMVFYAIGLALAVSFASTMSGYFGGYSKMRRTSQVEDMRVVCLVVPSAVASVSAA